jgi:tripartite-type tricarboxylate transporter receptor subunit TctC
MQSKNSFLWFILTLSMACILGLSPVYASEYPTRPISLISVYPPGGFFEVPGRAFAAAAEKLLGKPLVILNKPGAAGMIGTVAGAQAPPDGYTLTMGCTTISCANEWELINGRKPLATREDFILIGSYILSPTLISVPTNSPWKTLNDLVKDCKAKPNHYAFSSGGLYGMSHVPAELLMRATGIQCRHVPHKGGAPALSAVVGGHVDFTTQFCPSTIPLYRGNKLRVLAVQSGQRLKSIPEVPSVKELGIDAEYQAWIGILVPKGTPAPIVKKLREVLESAVKDKTFIDTIETAGEVVHYMNHEELAKFWDSESAKIAKIWAKVSKEPSPKEK